MPAWSSPRPSSRGEQSMPFDHSPRILRRPISMPFGIMVPRVASGTRSPAAMLNAPQHDLERLAVAGVDVDQLDLVGVGMRPQVAAPAATTMPSRPLADALDVLDRRCRGRSSPRASASASSLDGREARAARRAGPSAASELLQEADVVGEQLAQVVDAVAHLAPGGRCRSRRRSRSTPRGRCPQARSTLGWTMPQPPSSSQRRRRGAGCRTRPTAR